MSRLRRTLRLVLDVERCLAFSCLPFMTKVPMFRNSNTAAVGFEVAASESTMSRTFHTRHISKITVCFTKTRHHVITIFVIVGRSHANLELSGKELEQPGFSSC